MHCRFALSGTANCFLAWLAHCREVLFDTQQDATRARLQTMTVLLDIRSTSLAHHSDPSERCLARFTEPIEMCPNAFDERTCSRLADGTNFRDVATAGLYDRNILARCGGCRERHKYRQSQTSPFHVDLRSLDRAANRRKVILKANYNALIDYGGPAGAEDASIQ